MTSPINLWTTSHNAPSYSEFVSGIASALGQKKMEPTPEQKAVISAMDSAVLVMAGAGSGKTLTMSQKIAWHISQGHVSPNQVLGLTFTRKAAGQLTNKVRMYLTALRKAGLSPTSSNDIEWPSISTYNSFASDIASSYALLVGENPRARLVTDAERWQIMDKIVREWRPKSGAILDFTDNNPLIHYEPSTIVAVALSLAASMIDHGIHIEQLRAFLESEADTIQELEKIRSAEKTFTQGFYKGKATGISKGFTSLKESLLPLRTRIAVLPFVQIYMDYKREHGIIEFADQVRLARAIMTERPDIGKELRSRHKLILLDEYQDTSVNQAQLLKAAFKGDEDEQVHVTAVGDPNQAIYGWRGASANALQDFLEDFEVKKKGKLTLSTAWRNSRRILHCANALTASARPTDIVDECRSRCSDKVGEDDWPIFTVKEAVSQWKNDNDFSDLMELRPASTASEGRVVHVHRQLASQTYPAIASHIRDFMHSHRQAWEEHAELKQRLGEKTDSYVPPTMAVLVKYHRYAPAMIEALEDLNIAYEHIGGKTFVKTPEIRLIRALLSVAFFPSKNSMLLYLLNFFAVGAHDIQALARIGKKGHPEKGKEKGEENAGSQKVDMTLIESLAYLEQHASNSGICAQICAEFTEEGWKRLIHLASLVEDMRRAAHTGVVSLVQRAIDSLNLMTFAYARLSGQGKAKRTLDRFVAMAHQFDTDASAPAYDGELAIQSFLRWVDAVESYERGGDDDSSEDGATLRGCDTEYEDITPQEGVVQILTVHASKGLEWDLVAVPEMVAGEFDAIPAGKAKSWHKDKSALPWSLRSDFKHLPDVTVHTNNQIEQDKAHGMFTSHSVAEIAAINWAYIYGSLGDYQSAENRRLAYVALTRPKTELIIATSSYKNEKALQKAENEKGKRAAVPKKDTCSDTEQQKNEQDDKFHGQKTQEDDTSFESVSVFVHEIKSGVGSGVIDDDSDIGLKDADSSLGTKGDMPRAGCSADLEDARKEVISRKADSDKAGDSFSQTEVLHSEALDAIEKYLDLDPSEYAAHDVFVWPSCVDRRLDRHGQEVGSETVQQSIANLSSEERNALRKRWQYETKLCIAEHQPQLYDAPELDYLTASGLVHLHADSEQYLLQRRRPIPTEPSRAASLGTAVHEQIAHFFSRPAVLDIDSLIDSEQMPIDMDSQLSEERSIELVTRVKASRFADLPVIAIEQSIDVSLAGYPIRCVLDAVFDTSALPGAPKVTIVDWKTGRRPSLQQFPSRNMQLALYRLAWAQAHGEDMSEIGASFYYLGEEKPDKREMQAQSLSKEDIEKFIGAVLPPKL